MEAPKFSPHALRVLIIEDSPSNMLLASTFVELAGYKPLQAVSTVDGIQIAKDQHPDLILMDLSMPEMDGLSATRILKGDAATRDIPLIIVTGHALQGDRERARAAGCNGYLTKPITRRALLEVIESALHQQPPRSGPVII